MTYPAALDSFTAKTDTSDDVLAAHINDIQTALVNTQTELGTDPAASATDVKTRLAQSLDAYGNIKYAAETGLTISSGAVTASQNMHTIETESGAASDDLATINGGAAGDELYIRAVNGDHTVVVKHGTGNINNYSGADISLTEAYMVLHYIYNATLSLWLQVG